jgi:anthranilate phosphoribosyltransferase
MRQLAEGPTVFNMVAPLLHPLVGHSYTWQFIGVARSAWADVIAEAMRKLGSIGWLVVSNPAGPSLDEFWPRGKNYLVEVSDHDVIKMTIDADTLGVRAEPYRVAAAKKDDVKLFNDLLAGRMAGQGTEIVIANAALIYCLVSHINLQDYFQDNGEAVRQYLKRGMVKAKFGAYLAAVKAAAGE